MGGVVWAYLGIIFEVLTETVAWEQWEGTIEYTFMAPLARPVHLLGMGVFALFYGIVRASLLLGLMPFVFDLEMPIANFPGALIVLAVASVSFIGVGTPSWRGRGCVICGRWWASGRSRFRSGLAVFRRGEIYARRHGKLRRSG